MAVFFGFGPLLCAGWEAHKDAKVALRASSSKMGPRANAPTTHVFNLLPTGSPQQVLSHPWSHVTTNGGLLIDECSGHYLVQHSLEGIGCASGSEKFA